MDIKKEKSDRSSFTSQLKYASDLTFDNIDKIETTAKGIVKAVIWILLALSSASWPNNLAASSRDCFDIY